MGVDDNTNISLVIISPNPVQETLRINYPSSVGGATNFIIYNTLGEVMLNTSIDSTLSYDTSTWPNGLYILKIDETSYKIIVAH